MLNWLVRAIHAPDKSRLEQGFRWLYVSATKSTHLPLTVLRHFF
jgi:hypothetical protein